MLNHVIEACELLDSAYVNGEKVVQVLKERGGLSRCATSCGISSLDWENREAGV